MFNNTLAFLNATQDKHIVVSPLNVFHCLALLAKGARGKTLAQIQKVTNNLPPLTSFQNRGMTIGNANKLFIKQQLITHPGFNHCSANIEPLLDPPSASVNMINQWVKNNTAGFIPKLLNAGDIAPDVLMIAVQAMFFKGLWKSPFLAAESTVSTFYGDGGPTPMVPLMKGRRKRVLAYNGDLQLITLPMKHPNYGMTFILPRTPQPLRNLSQSQFDVMMNRRTIFDVDVTIPKFTMTSRLEVRTILRSLGITDIFSHGANFNGFMKGIDIHVSTIVHAAKILVHEKGAEGGAATGAIMKGISMTPYMKFTADHPFWFFVHSSDAVLMAGKCSVL